MKTADICHALERDMLDVAIVAGGTTPEGIMEYELFNDKFYAYVSPSSDLYERSNVRIEDIDLHHLVLLAEGNCLRDQILELLQGKHLPSNRYHFESESLATLARIVDCSACMTILPEMAIATLQQERGDQIKPLAKGAVSRKIALAVRRTYVKHSIIAALRDSIIKNAHP
jgi:LysR family hydrogen peroxide-inducible transcriptional activator